MKIAVAFAVLLATGSAARADDIQTAFAAVNDLFREESGGLVRRLDLCPKKNNENWAYATSATVASIDKNSAVLVDTLQCGGGNLHGQFLVVIQAGSAHVARDAGIGDMSFIVDRMKADGDKLLLYGSRWLEGDAHCCPSQKATLEYDLESGRHKLIITGDYHNTIGRHAGGVPGQN